MLLAIRMSVVSDGASSAEDLFFDLLRAVHVLATHVARAVEDGRYSVPQVAVLRALRRSKHALGMDDIARALGSSRPNATQLVARLAARGAIDVYTHPKPPFWASFMITQAGAEALDAALGQTRVRCEAVFGSLSERERRLLREIAAVIGNASDPRVGPTARPAAPMLSGVSRAPGEPPRAPRIGEPGYDPLTDYRPWQVKYAEEFPDSELVQQWQADGTLAALTVPDG